MSLKTLLGRNMWLC